MDTDLDKISDLPGHIIDNILSLLSIRDAVRTSILSSKWRYKWANLPHLVFDDQCILPSCQNQSSMKTRFSAIVDHVLLLHTGPIHKFKLSRRDFDNIPDIDRWILFVSRNCVKQFILDVWKGEEPYKLPFCLFSCKELNHLELYNCMIRPPSTFKGFGSLKSLDLQCITFTQEAFDNLISRCPLLEGLVLKSFYGFTRPKIHAPKLLAIDLDGSFEDIIFRNTSLLSSVIISLDTKVGTFKHPKHGNTCNLSAFLGCLPCIESLKVKDHFLQYLAVGKVPEWLPVLCGHLKYLTLSINFRDLKETLTTLCFLRSSPNLQELEVVSSYTTDVVKPVADFWKSQSNLDSLFNSLRVVKLSEMSGLKSELDFVSYLLESSPVLEKMTFKPAATSGGWEMVKELLRFKRASVQAEIIYLDP